MQIRTRTWVLIVWLQSLGAVRGQERPCTLQAFLDGPLFDPNFDTSDLQPSYGPGRQVRVGCSVGYSGFFKLICVEGRWQSRGSKCEPRSCGHPGEAQFADFHLEQGDDFVFGSKVVYTCHRGYQMVTRINSRRCMAAGWDGVVPICEAHQCPVINVDNNVVVIGDLEEANFGNVVRFRCKSNAEVLKGATEIYCNEEGEWSGQPPHCEEVKCEVPVVNNGIITGEVRDYKEHEILDFRCEHRFERIEKRPSKCTKTGSGAEWVPAPACEETKCELTLPPLEGTSYEPAYVTRFSPGASVTVQCGDAHWVVDSHQRTVVSTCQDTGEWTIRPLCYEVTCRTERDKNVRYWNVRWGETKRMGDKATYDCKWGFKKPNRNSEMTCTRDGWEPNPPCEEIMCDRREFPRAENTDDKQKYRVGERASYVCRDGYDGRFSLSCTLGGWEGMDLCKEKQCKRLDINDAYILDDERDHYPHGQQVRYRCQTDDERQFTISCQRGEWSGVQSCSECPRAEIANGFVIGPFRDKLYYTCHDGYKLFTRGWWAEATCREGVWSGLELCIDKRKCGEAPVIPNAQEVVPEREVRGGPQRLRITCREGYQAQVDVLTCHQGKWRSNELQLKAICTAVGDPCPPPPRVDNAVVTTLFQKEFRSGATVTYRCRHKFTLEGQDTIRCSEGSWERTDIRCTLYCFKPRDEQQTMIFTEDKERYLEGEEIFFRCARPGPIAGGNATCEGGEWSKPLGCEVCAVPPDVPHAFVSDNTKKVEYVQGHVIHFTCETGYITGPTIRYICSDGGWLALRKGSCYLKPCPLPEETANGFYQLIQGDDFVFGAKIQYFCNVGYQMVSKEDTRTCLLDQWTNHVPVCEPLSCELPPGGGGVTVKGLPDGEEGVLPDRFLTFSCDAPGKRLNGSAVLVCGSDGQWDHPFPSCQDTTCEVGELHPQLRVRGFDPAHTNMAVGHKLYFQCNDDDYVLDGATAVTCMQTGMWSPPIPTCAEKCRVPAINGGVQMDMYTPGTRVVKGVKVSLSCRLRGQVVHGSSEVECLGDGQWSSTFPTCGPPRDCPKAPPLSGGDTKLSTKFSYRHGEQVEYVCQRYYLMEGGPFKTCQNAEWTGEIRCLRPCTVDRDIMNQHHITFRHSRDDKIYSEPNDVIEFTCIRGTRPTSNTPMRQKCIDGQITLPSCE